MAYLYCYIKGRSRSNYTQRPPLSVDLLTERVDDNICHKSGMLRLFQRCISRLTLRQRDEWTVRLLIGQFISDALHHAYKL